MIAAPGQKSVLVLAECPTRHPLVDLALQGRPDAYINHNGVRTPHVPNIRYCGTKRTAKLCPQEKTQAPERSLHRHV